MHSLLRIRAFFQISISNFLQNARKIFDLLTFSSKQTSSVDSFISLPPHFSWLFQMGSNNRRVWKSRSSNVSERHVCDGAALRSLLRRAIPPRRPPRICVVDASSTLRFRHLKRMNTLSYSKSTRDIIAWLF